MAEETNLSTEQTDKLVYFQEVTRIDSIDECKQILEAFEWNIENAVQHAFSDQLQSSSTNAQQSLTSSTSSLYTNSSSTNNNNNINQQAANFNQTLNNFLNANRITAEHFGMQTDGTAATSSTNNVPSPSTSGFQRNRSTNSFNSSFSAGGSQLPSLSIMPQRTFNFNMPREPAAIPNGIFQWGVFIVAFPFRFLFSTLFDIFSLFYNFFEGSTPIPIDYDPLANIAEFAIYFNQKFGLNHPNFYEGSYAQAVAEAKRELKFLLVYIHQNDNKDCNYFATKTLSNPDLIEFVNNNLIFWACTKNLPEGQKVFNALKAKRTPFIGVIVLRSSRMALVSRIEGPCPAAELKKILENIMSEHEAELIATRADREQLQQNQLLRQQQDQAYLESLKLDKEKAQRKKEEEESKRKAEEQEKLKAEEERARENQVVNRRKELREHFANRLQPEATNPLAIKIGIKFPSGNRYERFFLKTDPLSDLYKFVFSNEECPSSFEITKNFPRKKIDCDDESKSSLEEAGLTQAILLLVCDLDA